MPKNEKNQKNQKSEKSEKSEKNEKDEKKKSKSKKYRYKKCLGVCYPKTVTQSNICDQDDDKDWQMSPFSNERYDLDEIQRLEKKGAKGKEELEALKKRLAGKEEPGPSGSAEEPVAEPKVQSTSEPPPKPVMDMNCAPEILYQPYGPLISPVRSYARPFNSRSSVYGYLGPSFYTAYRFRVPAPSTVPPIPCPEQEPRMPPNLADLSHYASTYGNFYIPLGP